MVFSSRFRKGPPPKLEILFLGTLVAELTKEMKGGRALYTFRYLPQFLQLRLAPLPGLPYSQSPRESGELWPYFAERIPDSRRPEIHAWMKAKHLTDADDIQLLAELGGHSVTDPFQIRLAA